MATITNKVADKVLVPEGTHVARCFKFMHLGHILNKFNEIRDTIRFSFELPDVTYVFDEQKGEEPMSISRDYGNFLGDSTTLKSHLQAWRGKAFTNEEMEGFDVENVVGAACMITVIHKTSKAGKLYAQITSITALPKSVTCPTQVNPTFIWNYNDHFDLKILENLHNYFQKIIKSSIEYKDLLKSDIADGEKFIDTPDVQAAPMPTIEDAQVIDDLPF